MGRGGGERRIEPDVWTAPVVEAGMEEAGMEVAWMEGWLWKRTKMW